ncbi:MAG: hypothetical protein M3071_17550 [Actinomycetota bacterium]|nr:hypothetical protein [Actinomycetota bacterium]
MKVAADINAAIVVNRAQPGAKTESESVSHVRIVQDSRSSGQGANRGDVPKTEQEVSDD